MAEDLHRLALTCLLPGFEGTTAPDWLRRRVGDGLGGVLLFARNVASPPQLARLAAALRAERPSVLVGMDEEGGDVTRLEAADGSSYPGNLALGVAADPALTRAVGAAIGAGLTAARWALRADGRATVGAGALVVELRPDPSIVVGDVPWGLGAALAAHDPSVTVLPYPITDPSPDGTGDAAALAGRAAGRPLVLVVRDLHRHGRQRDLVERLLLARPDAVVVEMGVPVLAPERAAGYLRTHGAGRVNAEAAADLLLGREPAAAGRTLPPEGRRTAR
jgi:hypothetical protein